MDDKILLKRLTAGSTRAMETAIRQYSAYVVTVIHNQSRGCLTPEDEEEIASDVFFSLCNHAKNITPGHLRPWLGRVCRNKTIDRLRQNKISVPLEEQALSIDDPGWEALNRKEQHRQLQAALKQLNATDQEIFYRYYELCQPATEIAADLQLPPSTVRTRLSRGRDTLRTILCQGGFSYEAES